MSTMNNERRNPEKPTLTASLQRSASQSDDIIEANQPAVGNATRGADERPPAKELQWRKPHGIPITDWLMAFFTLVLMASSILYTGFAGLQWRVMNNQIPELQKSAQAAKDAAQTAQKELEMTQRPWMVVKLSLRGPIHFDASGNMLVKLGVTIKNIGHSVATNVSNITNGKIWTGHGAGLDWTIHPAKYEQQLCDEWRGAKSTSGVPHNPLMLSVFETHTSSARVLFPDQSFSQDVYLGYGSSQLADANVGIPKSIHSLIVFGCVDYTSSFGSQHHVTGYVMEIYEPVQGHIPIGKNVWPSRLEINDYQTGSFVD